MQTKGIKRNLHVWLWRHYGFKYLIEEYIPKYSGILILGISCIVINVDSFTIFLSENRFLFASILYWVHYIDQRWSARKWLLWLSKTCFKFSDTLLRKSASPSLLLAYCLFVGHCKMWNVNQKPICTPSPLLYTFYLQQESLSLRPMRKH